MIRRIAVLASVALFSIASPSRALPVELTCSNCSKAGIDISIVAESTLPASGDQHRFQAKVPSTTELDLDPGAWTLRVESDEVWAAPVDITVTGDDGLPMALALPVVRAGWVSAPTPQLGKAIGVDVQLSFQAPAATPPEKRLAGVTACQVAQRALQCKLPAGVHDLVLAAEGFAPIHRFDVAVGADARVRLGEVRWSRGASVHGWITGPDGSPAPGAEITLAPFVGPASATPEAVHRSRRGTVTSTADHRGYFQLTGLTPDMYRVEANDPSGGRLRLVDPLDVAADDALELELALAAPMSWTVFVTPGLAPDFAPWRVSLRPLDDRPGEASPNITGVASPSGGWTWEQARAGRYGLDVMMSNGDSFHSEMVTIDDQVGVLAVDVAAIAVRGTVQRDDEPVSGTLRLSAAEGHDHARFELDDEGAFEGFLPRAGRWWPDVEIAGETSMAVTLDPVEIESASLSDPAVLALEIPDTRLHGQVVDANDMPVAEATVTIRNGSHVTGHHGRGKPSGLVRTGEDGTFSVDGLAPGPLTLSARHGSATSAEQYIDLVESEPGAPLRLVLREKVAWSGQVQRDGHPIAGARLTLWSDRSLRGGGFSTGLDVGQTVSRDDGVFEVHLPAEVERVVVLASAPGMATRFFRASRAERERLLIGLTPGGGRLHILGGGARGLAGRWFEHQGIVVPFVLLGRIMPGFDPRREVATLNHLASGEYALCRLSPDSHEPTCDRAFLAPGGEATLGDTADVDGSGSDVGKQDQIVSDERSLNE